MIFNKQRLVFLLVLTGFVCLGVVGLIIVNNFRFRLISESPDSNSLPTGTSEIAFIFNKELSDINGAGNVSFSPSINFKTSVDKKVFKIQFASLPSANSNLTVKLTDIKSTSGKLISFTRSYEVKYVQWKDLTEYEKQRQVDASDNYATYDPIISQLPIRTSEYVITYTIPYNSSNNSSKPLILNVRLVSPDFEYTNQYISEILSKVKADIKNRGFDPNKYNYDTGLELSM